MVPGILQMQLTSSILLTPPRLCEYYPVLKSHLQSVVFSIPQRAEKDGGGTRERETLKGREKKNALAWTVPSPSVFTFKNYIPPAFFFLILLTFISF